MTSPVTTDDLVQGCVKWLLDQPAVHTVLGTFPGTAIPFLFQNQRYERIEGTSSTAAVIARAGGWAGANEYNTASFPRLSLEIWADPIRDAGNITDPGEAYRRLHATFRVFDRLLHRPQGGTVMWGSVRTLTCTRQAEPAVYSVPDGDGMLRMQVFYGVTEA